MKKAKTVLWIIIIGSIGLIIFQNWDYFNARQTLSVDLFFDQYLIPEFSNYFFFLGCFLLGLLLPYIYGFVERLKLNKLIKKLKETTAAQQEEISGLKRELEMMQQRSIESDREPIETPDPAAEI